MKFLNVLLITLFATTLFWGCSDDDDSTAGVNSSISLSTGIVQVDKKGGEVSVTVTSGANLWQNIRKRLVHIGQTLYFQAYIV